MKRPIRAQIPRGVLATALVLLGVAAAVPVARAHIEELYPSVHFNTEEPDFGAPPRPFTITSWGETASRPGGSSDEDAYLGGYGETDAQQLERTQRSQNAIDRAQALTEKGAYSKAIAALHQAMAYDPDTTATVRDMIEALRQATVSTNRTLLSRYIEARRRSGAKDAPATLALMRRISADPKAGYLRAHALYAVGAILYEEGTFSKAASIFEQCAARYPNSPRCEAALIMAGRSLLAAPQLTSEDVWVQRQIPAKDAIRARRDLEKLLHRYPHSRFQDSALGWLARSDYVRGRYTDAMCGYLRQLAQVRTPYDRTATLSSLRYTSRKLRADQARQLGVRLRSQPDLVIPYLDYRLYHTSPGPSGLQHLENLARQALKKAPRTFVPTPIAARLAEIDYLLAHYSRAVRWADKAIKNGRHSSPGKDLALYVRGGSERRLYHATEALWEFRKLLAQYPHSYLRGGARENLALLYEHSGQLGKALDQYFALGYHYDVVYLLDARMSPAQIASYIHAHLHNPERNLLAYSLALRYLRLNDLDKASAWLSRVPAAKLVALSHPGKWKDIGWENVDWPVTLYDPRQTIKDLRGLERGVSVASTRDAKAAAMYALATYYYNHRDLLLYNPALWQGWRSYAFDFWWNSKAATHRDTIAARENHYQVECIAHTREICLKIVKEYPNSPTAPKALYRAACATRRLADFDWWWRDEADRRGFWPDAIHLMKEVVRKYPHSPLARPARKFAGVYAKEAREQMDSQMFSSADKTQRSAL